MNPVRGRVASICLTVIVCAVNLGPGAHAQGGSPSPARSLSARIDAAIVSAADSLHDDPDAERAWVANNVARQSYDGELKGARGAFLTRAANDVDAANLLGRLLDASGVTYRFATCDTVPGSPSPADGWQIAAGMLAIDFVPELAAAVDDPELQQAFRAVADIRDAERAASAAETKSLAASLETRPLIAGYEATPESTQATPTGAAARHVWVQMAWGAEWRDLDPTTSDGKPPCSPTAQLDSLPDDWDNRLRVSLEVERRMNGRLTTTDALSVDLRTADVVASSLTFTFGETSGISRPIPWTVGSLAAYTPVLLVDGKATTGTTVHLPPSSRDRDPLSDVFASPAPGGALNEPDPVTGAWLRIELVSPNGSVVQMRSQVFDRIGVAARMGGEAASAPVNQLTEIRGDYPEVGALWQIGFLLGETRAPEVAADGTVQPAVMDRLPAQLDQLLQIFPSAYHDLGGQEAGPMVLLAGLSVTDTPDGLGSRLVLDALHVPGKPPSDASAAARDAEAVLGAESLILRLLDLQPVPSSDATAVFDAARAEGIPLRWLVPGDGPSIPGASADAVARMAQRLREGDLLLTPASVPEEAGVSQTAWWVVDPLTGVVRDEHESGRHQVGENAVEDQTAVRAAKAYEPMSCRLGGVLVLAAFLLTVGLPGLQSPPAQLIGAIAKTYAAAEKNRQAGEAALKIACRGG